MFFQKERKHIIGQKFVEEKIVSELKGLSWKLYERGLMTIREISLNCSSQTHRLSLSKIYFYVIFQEPNNYLIG